MSSEQVHSLSSIFRLNILIGELQSLKKVSSDGNRAKPRLI